MIARIELISPTTSSCKTRLSRQFNVEGNIVVKNPAFHTVPKRGIHGRPLPLHSWSNEPKANRCEMLFPAQLGLLPRLYRADKVIKEASAKPEKGSE